MWRTARCWSFVDWLRACNDERGRPTQVGFYGLDLYSLYTLDPRGARATSTRSIPTTPRPARARALRLPLAVGGRPGRRTAAPAFRGRYRGCERRGRRRCSRPAAATARVRAARRRRASSTPQQNARWSPNAERYYRAMYYGAPRVVEPARPPHVRHAAGAARRTRGDGARAVVWAHNSHLGDAAATEMGARGEHNVGQLVPPALRRRCYFVGFGTDHGTVAAADDWDEPMRDHAACGRRTRAATSASATTPARRGVPAAAAARPRTRSCATLCCPSGSSARSASSTGPRPSSRATTSSAALPRQFDEWIWFDETRAVSRSAFRRIRTSCRRRFLSDSDSSDGFYQRIAPRACEPRLALQRRSRVRFGEHDEIVADFGAHLESRKLGGEEIARFRSRRAGLVAQRLNRSRVRRWIVAMLEGTLFIDSPFARTLARPGITRVPDAIDGEIQAEPILRAQSSFSVHDCLIIPERYAQPLETSVR